MNDDVAVSRIDNSNHWKAINNSSKVKSQSKK